MFGDYKDENGLNSFPTRVNSATPTIDHQQSFSLTRSPNNIIFNVLYNTYNKTTNIPLETLEYVFLALDSKEFKESNLIVQLFWINKLYVHGLISDKEVFIRAQQIGYRFHQATVQEKQVYSALLIKYIYIDTQFLQLFKWDMVFYLINKKHIELLIHKFEELNPQETESIPINELQENMFEEILTDRIEENELDDDIYQYIEKFKTILEELERVLISKSEL